MQSIESSISFESQISRTSSPLPTELNPLSVHITDSSEQNDCLTPIKTDNNLDSNENGLLTYSTPIYYQQFNSHSALAAYELLKRSTPYSAFNAFSVQKSSSIEKRKPKVNFHCIDDLASGDKSENDSIQNDSGYNSRVNPSSFESSPSIIQSQFNKKLDEIENEEMEDKENIDQSKKQAITDNGKKVRTTFTDEQKKALDAYFRKNPYPDPKETEDLSQQLVLPENVIKVWFQNKRSRDKQRKFSHKSRNNNMQQNMNNPTELSNIYSSSPIVANIQQLLTSRLNSYAAMAAVASNQNYLNSQKFL